MTHRSKPNPHITDNLILTRLSAGPATRSDLVYVTAQNDRYVRSRIHALQRRGEQIVSDGKQYVLASMSPEQLDRKATTLERHGKSSLKTASLYRRWSRRAANPQMELR